MKVSGTHGAGEPAIRPHGLDEARHRPGGDRARVDLDRLAHQHQQIRAGRAGVQDGDLADERRDGGRHQLFLRTVAAVDRRLPDPGAIGYVVHAQLAHPALGDQLQRAREDRVIGPDLPWPPQRRWVRAALHDLRN
jgi:hypothetical protein